MLLRRVIEHVRTQSWTAIGIDFVIVVVGVFVGIQFSNWNEERRDTARAYEYLERIQADLAADVDRFDSRIDRWRAVTAHGSVALAFARDGLTEGQTSWDVLLSFYQASDWLPFTSTNTTFQEMTSAGEIGLIADTELRTDVSAYYAVIEFREPLYFGEDPAYRRIIRGITPMPIQDYFWAECYRGATSSDPLACGPSISAAETRDVVEAYLATPDVVTELRYRVNHLGRAVASAQRDRDRAAALAARIQETVQ
jgi:hypothetical protein